MCRDGAIPKFFGNSIKKENSLSSRIKPEHESHKARTLVWTLIYTKNTMSTNDNKEEQMTISKLGPFDVLCGRDKKCNNNAGNHQFRVLINSNLDRYMLCTSKFERSKIISMISEEILDNPNGSIRFFKRVQGSAAQDSKTDDDGVSLLEQLDRKKSHEKIAHALRDYAVQQRKNQKRHENSMAQQQPMPPQQTGTEEPGHRTTPLIANLTEQARIAQRQMAQAQYENRPSMTSQHRVSLENPDDFVGFDGHKNYATQLNTGEIDPTHRVSIESTRAGGSEVHQGNLLQPLDAEYPQRGLVSVSNHRHLERFEGTIDGSLHRSVHEESQSGEDYDTFDVAPLPPGNSLRHMEVSSLRQMEGVERTGSHQSVGSRGNRQNSINQMDVFERGPSSRSFRSRQQESIDEMSLLQTSMGTLSLGTSNMTGMSYQGDSTLTLQTRPELLTDGSSTLSTMDLSFQGVSTLTLQTRPDLISDRSRMEMSFENPIE